MPTPTSIFAPELFRGKTAIVTGGGSGIGYSIAGELAGLGCQVVIASRDLAKLKRAAFAINSALPEDSPGHTTPVACNIRNEEDVKALMATTVSRFGAIDYLVNNSGGQFKSAVADITSNGFHSVVDLNLRAPFLCCREAYLQSMRAAGGGCAIVNIIADVEKGFPMMAHSGAARAGVDNLTKTLAVEWAESAVRINAVAPGLVHSESAVANYKDDDVFQRHIENIPAKRLATPEEIAGTVIFLLSPAAAYITGTTVKVDGGLSLYRTCFFEVADHDNWPHYGQMRPPRKEQQQRARVGALGGGKDTGRKARL